MPPGEPGGMSQVERLLEVPCAGLRLTLDSSLHRFFFLRSPAPVGDLGAQQFELDLDRRLGAHHQRSVGSVSARPRPCRTSTSATHRARHTGRGRTSPRPPRGGSLRRTHRFSRGAQRRSRVHRRSSPSAARVAPGIARCAWRESCPTGELGIPRADRRRRHFDRPTDFVELRGPAERIPHQLSEAAGPSLLLGSSTPPSARAAIPTQEPAHGLQVLRLPRDFRSTRSSQGPAPPPRRLR